jgi:1,4-dihydroxy-2-naphthoate octaprenyltransferase
MKNWIKAFRLRTLPLSFACVIVGVALAYFYGQFNYLVSAFVLLTTLFLQILSNLANDYGDFTKKVDNENRVGEARTLQLGLIKPKAMKVAIILFSFLSLLSGILLLYFSFDGLSLSFLIFFLVGLVAIAAAIKYTMGKNPYGYKAMGDIAVFIFFGWVAVIGTYYLNAINFEFTLLFPATAMGLFSTAVLNINNMRDRDSDRLVDKNTLPVIMGLKWAKKYHYLLIILAFVLLFVFVLLNFKNYWQFLFY